MRSTTFRDSLANTGFRTRKDRRYRLTVAALARARFANRSVVNWRVAARPVRRIAHVFRALVSVVALDAFTRVALGQRVSAPNQLKHPERADAYNSNQVTHGDLPDCNAPANANRSSDLGAFGVPTQIPRFLIGLARSSPQTMRLLAASRTSCAEINPLKKGSDPF
jgi:hypothetical protein